MKPAVALLSVLALAFLASPAHARMGPVQADVPGGARLEAPPGETAAPRMTLRADGPIGQEGEDDDGPDILFLALITTASVGGAAVLFSLGYLLRKRIGYDPHRPPQGDDGGDGH